MIIFFISWLINWVDTKPSDFLKGTYDQPSLYVSKRLSLETTQDSGAIEYSMRFDVNNDGWYDLASADQGGGTLYVWLGSLSGYAPANRLVYSMGSSGGWIDMADLNIDGYTELLHAASNMGNLYIYWGTPAGPSSTNYTLLPNGNGEGVYVADLNKDTYLDILITNGDKGITPCSLFIYWGSSADYSTANRLSMPGAALMFGGNVEVADLDKNGWLDIIVTEFTSPYNIMILYGDSVGYTTQILHYTNSGYPHRLSLADLNKDGWLDIVTTGYNPMNYSSIFWGSPTGYSLSNKLDIHPGECFGGSAVGDFNNDGWLDIVYFRGPWNAKKPLLYYNDTLSPYFQDADTVAIGNVGVGASGGTVADFDKDGDLDISMDNYIGHSYVLYGPTFTNYTEFPTKSIHHGCFREAGSLYDRSQCAYYISRVFGDSLFIDSGIVSWIAYEPGGSKVEICIRTGDTNIPDTLWTDWVKIDSNSAMLPDSLTGYKYLQYRAELQYDNPAQLPWLERVEINVTSAGAEENQFHGRNNFDINIPTVIREILRIKIYSSHQSTPILQVFDVSGKLCKSMAVNLTKGEQIIEWKLSGLGSGIYFLRVGTQKQKFCIIQ